MPTGGRQTLTQFIIESRRSHPEAKGDLNGLVTAVALACKAVSRKAALGALFQSLGEQVALADHDQGKLVALSSEMFVRACEWGGHTAGLASAEQPEPYALPARFQRGKYLLLFDALDGAANLDVDATVGSIFSILRAPVPGEDPAPGAYLQPGSAQVCAGYAIYGPATMLVLTFGAGTHAFTLEPQLGEWVLSHSPLTIPAQAREFAINGASSRFWEPAVKRYVDECLLGKSGPRGADFGMRWVASLVAETHRILLRGGVFLHPEGSRDPLGPGRQLLHEANPIAFLVEQAGGRASTGRARILEVIPESLHQRVGFVFGSRDEVARIETYHREEGVEPFRSPLFGERGLFSAEDDG